MFNNGIMVKRDVKQMQDVYNKLGIEYNEDILDSYVSDLLEDYDQEREIKKKNMDLT